MLTIKLIEVSGQYKALVLDMARLDNRLLYIASGTDKDAVWNEAEAYLDGITSEGLTWH